MSHEIRTPINGIVGVIDMLRVGVPEAESAQLLELLDRSSRGLLSIINDVLDLSKIEAGKLSIVPRPTSLRSVVSDLVTLYGAAAREKRLEIVWEVTDTVPELITIDDGRVRQIITNLVGNAVKFTPDQGGILVYVNTGPSNDERSTINLAIADSGIGIPKNYLKYIFEAFSQANSSVSRRYGGTGLGLSITNRLVEMMGGTIEVKSKEGISSLFPVNLPYETLTTQPMTTPHATFSSEPSEGFGKGLRILLAEDNVINQRVAANALEKFGFAVTIVGNGKAAVESQMTGNFDLILMDCHMPDMSGFEATSQLRTIPEGSTVPIIALTALAMEGDRDKCLAAGMNDYLSKPFTKAELGRTIARWLRNKSNPQGQN
jgi:CheY-like chemotaxis protein